MSSAKDTPPTSASAAVPHAHQNKNAGRGNIFANMDAPAPAVVAARPAPLTEESLQAMSGFLDQIDADGVTYCEIGKMTSIEHPEAASRASKIGFINQMADVINGLTGTAPITLISVGSGGLLMEHLLHHQLSETAQARVRWRCIDPAYKASMAPVAGKLDQAQQAFCRDKRNVLLFSTAEAYLAADGANGKAQASELGQGAAFVMVINPPAVVRGKSSQSGETDSMLCMPLAAADIAEANAVYVLISPEQVAGRNERLAAALKQRRAVDKLHIKCYPDSRGDIQFQAGSSLTPMIVNFMQDDIQARFEENDEAGLSAISRLYAAADSFAREVTADDNSMSLLAIPCNEFRRGVDRLKQVLHRSPGPASLATLENSETSITRLN